MTLCLYRFALFACSRQKTFCSEGLFPEEGAMAQNDSNSEDALDDLVSRVKSRQAEGRPASVPVQHGGGLKPSEILFMPAEQKIGNRETRRLAKRYHGHWQE